MTRPPFLLAIVVLLSISVMGQLENKRDELESRFGKAVDNTGFLYQYNDDYMIKFCFDKPTSHIIGFKLAPRTFFKVDSEQPNEPDPSLRRSDYDAVLAKTDEIWPIGDLKASSTVAIVTNLRGRWIDVYENAIAERAQRGIGNVNVDFSHVWFFRPISGIVEETVPVDINPKLHMWQVRIGGYWYWTQIHTSRRQQFTNLIGAGPIGENCRD